MKQGSNEQRKNGRRLPATNGRSRSIKSARLAIVGGCGHVGLPLGMAFARAGCSVDLIDVSPDRIREVNRGRMPFFEAGADELLPQLIGSGKIRATTDDSVIKNASAVIVTIGTPAGAKLDLSGIHRTAARLQAGQLLVLRSTVPAGTTNQLAMDLKAAGRGDVDLAYCPERIVQGKSLEELSSLPQLVAGVTARAARRAATLFKLIATQIIHLQPIEAELAKLFCNAYRYIHFAISNQFYMVAEEHNADFYRIFHALRENYPRMQSFARPGFAAGPCLVKDTQHLGSNISAFPLGEAALTVNGTLPRKVVEQLRQEFPLDRLTIGILGMAFKPECDDPRDSLSYELRDLLEPACRRVLCTDPYVPDAGLVGLDLILEQADLLVVATPHACYRALKCRQPVFDLTDTLTSSQSNGHSLQQFAIMQRTASRNGRFIATRNGKAKQRKRA